MQNFYALEKSEFEYDIKKLQTYNFLAGSAIHISDTSKGTEVTKVSKESVDYVIERGYPAGCFAEE